MSIKWRWQRSGDDAVACNATISTPGGLVPVACTAVKQEDREGWVVVVATTSKMGALWVLWHGDVSDRRGVPALSAEQSKAVVDAVRRWTP